MRSLEQCHRLAFEKALLGRVMPQVQFYNYSHDTYVEGAFGVAGNWRDFILRSDLPADYSDGMPTLSVISPHTLFRNDGGTINELGLSHAFHTCPNGPGGCVRICHCRSQNWDASRTLVEVFTKGALWLSAYQAHLETGRSLSEFMLNDGDPLRTVPAYFEGFVLPQCRIVL